ncbi:hypothetical protein FYK55_04115 [Roseiconus nitratireducens]|uniref:Aerotolerance regulator N-terminal domain-containing protein n=1 Tax=Roseiconus nitratireducens TaxID=2605748 RepID=A0A5M6DIP6_9BACT|nr:BatA domain-containing protein [Roseiconus nitratireducens]KAA5546092.1 hypothetical protein FYK55_04115 [Roseiconus nitratireducens]
MFLYPALLAGFAFVAVPLLVHLINMLRHRRQRWAAMEFLLASYRKQKKWLRMRQLLLLLARLAVAFLLVALLCGWTGGRRLLSVLGGQTTHHIVVLDDSYSMGDQSGSGEITAYGRARLALQQLTRQLAGDEGNHQLTVMRASRAALAMRGGSDSGDAAADLSARTVNSDAGLIARVMSTDASPIRTDLVSALDLAAELAEASSADEQKLYIASDFRQRDWESSERLAESMRRFAGDDVEIRMIDCAARPEANLAITALAPVRDVWVAGVPVVVRVSIKNYGQVPAENVTMACRVIRYDETVSSVDPSRRVSGVIENLPGMVIESLAPGAEITKSFQVFVNQTGTHAIEVELPPDAMSIDNTRVCTLPLSDVERVLVIDSDPDQSGASTIAAVLDPGSQVRIGAVPDLKPPGFLRQATIETLTPYRAIYLINLPEISETSAAVLQEYVRAGGGLAWFLGDQVQPQRYNSVLLSQQRQLLPALLESITPLESGGAADAGDLAFADQDTLIDPLRGAGDSVLAMVGLAKSWIFSEDESGTTVGSPPDGPNANPSDQVRFRSVLRRRDGRPLVTEHTSGAGTVVTVLTGLDPAWTNWAGDPTFVPFMLLANARLWSGAAAATSRTVDSPLEQRFSLREFFPEVKLLTPVQSPPRVTIEMTAESDDSDSASQTASIILDPVEWLIAGQSNVDDLLQPGVTEWGLLRAEGGGKVIPTATVIENGEGDLQRADAAEIQRALLPLEVEFVSSDDWNQQTQLAGSSSIALMLLAILGLLLAAEQALAYWASYHSSGETRSPAELGHLGGRRPAFGLDAGSTTSAGGKA